MEPAELPKDAETPAPTRQKRSRAGCLTCRTRRRKCDEGKPECQNCIDKGFGCRYAEAFQILGKNNFTPEVSRTVQYSNLRFVSDDGDKIDPAQETESSPATKDAKAGKASEKHLEKTNFTLALDELAAVRALHKQLSPSTERYEFALHGLLALGSRSGGAGDSSVDFVPQILPEQVSTSPSDRNEPLLTGSQQSPQKIDALNNFSPTSRLPSWLSTNAIISAEVPELSDERALELLKHYRYGIAPWLDICDMNQCFGIKLMQLSTTSTSIRYRMLALAEASLNARHLSQDSNLVLLAQMQQRQEPNQTRVQHALLSVLEVAQDALADLSTFWLQGDSSSFRSDILESLLPELGTDSLAGSVFWLLARLELSIALMSPSSLKIPLPTASIAAKEYSCTGHADEVFQYAQAAVALCIDAAIFSRGDDDRWLQQRYGLNRVDLWNTLVAGLQRWYNDRPNDFQPIIELYPRDGRSSEDEFPTIVFSSGATTLANQLYHTGMLLLLQNRPRFVDRQGPNSPSLSLLWQTHRICGIAVNNDQWDWWDPSLLASLLIAAKTATHHSQHQVILSTLEAAQRLTGWNIAYHAEQLRHEWQQAEDW